MEPVLQNMPVFEVIFLMVALWFGTSSALLPEHAAAKRPMGPIWNHALSTGALLGLLPICADSSRFPIVLALAVSAALAGRFSMLALKRESATAQRETARIASA